MNCIKKINGLLSVMALTALSASAMKADVVVYGGTSAAVTAAVQAKKLRQCGRRRWNLLPRANKATPARIICEISATTPENGKL
ncbi:hypothetical protein PDESU_04901 [Pontiella desulfatans]|uniref:Uncharacterized protein n=1 Tax=Pontiella desulfatans TaxID=2750659 RepID=A0A6C2U8C9_PONDE|nr:hypothetical protein [Pontiella desulfatans]VGO16310.1 hypothetical protein PDESU_04901 [Pontiella desulfatans]